MCVKITCHCEDSMEPLIMNVNYNGQWYEGVAINFTGNSRHTRSFTRCKKHFTAFKRIPDFPWYDNKLSRWILFFESSEIHATEILRGLTWIRKNRTGFCRERSGKVVKRLEANLSQKNRRRNSGDAWGSYWPCELVAKIWSSETPWRVAFVGFPSYTKAKYFIKEKRGCSRVRAAKSVAASKFAHGIVTFLGGFQRPCTMINDLWTRQAGETSERTNDLKRAVEQTLSRIRNATYPYFRLPYAVVAVHGSRSHRESSSGPSRLKANFYDTFRSLFCHCARASR